MATLKQIARAAGVAVSVASRALNPKPDMHARVAPATRQKIRMLAKRMGYHPNRAAEFLKRGQTPSIGAFLPAFAPSLFKGLVVGIAEAAAKEGFPVQFNFDLTPAGYRRFLDNTPDLSHCGLITSHYNARTDLTNRMMERFQAANGQLVAVHYHLNLPGVCTVAIDDIEGGRIAARHLLTRGCRNFIGYNCVISPTADDWRSYRTRGFKEILSAAGVKPALYNASAANISAICKSCRRGNMHPTGIFCVSDRDAVLLMNALQKSGLTVGRDALVIGYDDLYLTADISPALTTLHQPMREIGALAARKVIKMIYGGHEESALIPPRLVVRASG